MPSDDIHAGGSRGFEAKDPRVEIEFAVQCGADILRPPKSVLLTFEGDVRMGNASSGEHRHHRLRLIRRDDAIFETLKEDHWTLEPFVVMNRRTFDIAIALRRQGADQPIRIARFEFVSVSCEGFEIADSVVAGSGGKDVVEGQRAESRVAARASPTDRKTVGVHDPLACESPRNSDAVLDVDDAPGAFEPIAIRATVAG